jgi:hypothetical protein
MAEPGDKDSFDKYQQTISEAIGSRMSRIPPARFGNTGSPPAVQEATGQSQSDPPAELYKVIEDVLGRDAGYYTERVQKAVWQWMQANPPVRSSEVLAKKFREEVRKDPDAAPEGTRESLAKCVRMIEDYIPEALPANEHGQVHFARAVIESVSEEIKTFLERPLAENQPSELAALLKASKEMLERATEGDETMYVHPESPYHFLYAAIVAAAKLPEGGG